MGKRAARNPEAFWQKVQTHFFQDEASELDYADFVDFGEACGLLRQVKYHVKTHGEGLLGDPEPGDDIYILVPRSKKASR